MTKTLQDLIDEAIFISTEYQARLAELTGESDWSVDFSAPSFTLKSDPSVSLTPSLLGTESEQRGSWIWSWQELGHFPDEVVAAAVQAREAGENLGVQELTTDELVLSEGLARRLTLAAKAVTGLFAHYPAAAGGGVRAWLLVDGPQLELPEPTVHRMGRVMAQALQTNTAVHHQRAVDSYARLRGAHISWDTEACAVITASDGALRLWFDEHRISGIEPAEPVVDQRDLARAAKQAEENRQSLRADARRALSIAHRESEQQRRAREEAEAQRVAATEAALSDTTEAPTATPIEQTEGVEPARADGVGAPFDQEPREDAEPGIVSTHVVPDEGEESVGQTRRDAVPAADVPSSAPVSDADLAPEQEAVTDQHPIVEEQTVPLADGAPADSEDADATESALDRLRAEQAEAGGRPQRQERPAASAGSSATGQRSDDRDAQRYAEPVSEQEEAAERQAAQAEDGTKKKGFFSRFFGL
ncbi:DUF6882 domain-containing protein [Curtobacterium sp. S6]|uniref:DUF6882 domain-containing protein n=1 Tax=Curtobacterium sp. S6 TaxID=1479623 RepID=UPI0004AA10CC|nr:DUF6882 domain-containing protein [Curtobacterium sp. S6]